MIYSASHVVIMLVERYPDYFIVNLDKVRNLSYQITVKNRYHATTSLLLIGK